MVSAEGKVKILDFGLAKVFDAEKAGSSRWDGADDHGEPAWSDHRDDRLHESRAGAGQAGAERDRTSGDSGACCSRCYRGSGRSRGRRSPTRSRRSWRGGRRFEALPAGLARASPGTPQRAASRRIRRRDCTTSGTRRLEIERILAGASERAAGPEASGGWAARRAAGRDSGWCDCGSWFWSGSVAGKTASGPLIADRDRPWKETWKLLLREGPSFTGFDSPLLDVSPDGKSIVFVGSAEGGTRLFLRRLDRAEIRQIEGTEEAIHRVLLARRKLDWIPLERQGEDRCRSAGATRSLFAAPTLR